LDIPYYREYRLPWTRSASEEQRFRRLLAIILGVTFFLGAVWPWIPTPAVDPNEVEEIPPRIAKLLLEQKPPPPPPKPPEPEPEPEPDAIDKPEPEKVAEEPPPPEPEPEPKIDYQQIAREQAQAALLPFTEDLAALADSDVLDKVADARPLTASVGQAARNQRSMITSKAGTASSGINTANMSRNTGGSGLAGRNTTAIEASRSREEIELVFDRNKGAIFALYNRALRMDPTLEGKLVLRLTIAPTGEVTFCEIVSSELGDAQLERKLVQRIKLFRFEAKDVEAITTTKPIDFFPA
jgi:TonB family protein